MRSEMTGGRFNRTIVTGKRMYCLDLLSGSRSKVIVLVSRQVHVWIGTEHSRNKYCHCNYIRWNSSIIEKSFSYYERGLFRCNRILDCRYFFFPWGWNALIVTMLWIVSRSSGFRSVPRLMVSELTTESENFGIGNNNRCGTLRINDGIVFLLTTGKEDTAVTNSE